MVKIITTHHEGKRPTPIGEVSPGMDVAATVRDVTRVAAYCRVSTLEEEQSLSYEAQKKYYRALFAKDNKKILIGVYGDQGVTGTSIAKRPGFQDLLRDCMQGKIDEIYTKSISRFSRNYTECLESITQLKNLGVVIHFEKERFSTDNESMKMILQIMACMAQEEVNSISQNILLAHQYRNKKGDPMRAAVYGYRRDKYVTDGIHQWKIKDDEAERVRLVYQYFLAGHSLKEIANMLNEYEKERNGTKFWTGSSVGGILQNVAYIGDLITNKTYTADYLTKEGKVNKGERRQYYIKNHHPAIISREDFKKVAKMRGRDLPECMENQE